MKSLAFCVGLAAVTLYLLGYLQKKRTNIIVLNATSRVLYIIQYILLSAFEGAVLDVAGVVSSFLAQKKDTPLIKKRFKVFIGSNILIVAMGLLLYKNIFSILPIIGVVLHTSAFWIDDEKIIRRVSLLGCPFWFVYNFVSEAYGSCIGDFLSMVSIAISMYRYDFKKIK
ncbi:MAG: YgjV family protein [Clostridia bacterium]|nr:YgjV family protein [Clostridia bacterium]